MEFRGQSYIFSRSVPHHAIVVDKVILFAFQDSEGHGGLSWEGGARESVFESGAVVIFGYVNMEKRSRRSMMCNGAEGYQLAIAHH